MQVLVVPSLTTTHVFSYQCVSVLVVPLLGIIHVFNSQLKCRYFYHSGPPVGIAITRDGYSVLSVQPTKEDSPKNFERYEYVQMLVLDSSISVRILFYVHRHARVG